MCEHPILLILFTLLRAGVQAGANDGPVGRWEFGEGRDSHIHDTSGHKNDGLSRGANWVELEEGYALEFTGGRGHVNCGRGPSLDVTGPITLEVWIYPTAPASSETGIAGKSFYSYGMTYYTDGRVWWYINTGGNRCAAPVKIKTWSHVVGTFDGKTIRLYVNGRLADTAVSQFDAIKHGGDFLIGCIEKGDLTRSFNGAIGSVRVYDRALSAKDVRAHYRAEVKHYPRPPSKYDRMVVTPFYALDKGRVFLDADFSYRYPFDKGAKASVELRRAGADGEKPLQRHPLPPLPDTGVLRDAMIEVGQLAAGDYELRVVLEDDAGVRDTCTIRFAHPHRVSVPAPSERTVPPLAAPPKPVDYAFELGKGGGFTIGLKGDRYPVESAYSYPHGGQNVLGVSSTSGGDAEPGWKVETKHLDATTSRVTAGGKHYTIKRLIERRPGRVLVKDTITNTSGAELGILLSNHIKTGGVSGLQTTRLPNPSVFMSKAGQGLGMVALDDVYLEQHKTFDGGGRCGIRSDLFGLDTNASYTLEWAIYLNASGDYYDFVNQVRKDHGYLPKVEGGFAFTDRRKSPSKDYVRSRALRYASIGCLGKVPDDPGLSLEGVEFTAYPKECALLKATFAETRRRFPSMKVMFHIAHSLYTTNRPKEVFGDSRVINSAGKQTDYGGQNVAYYGKYFSKKRVDEGYRWYIFYPTMTNSFGKAMLNAIDYMLDELGVNGMFADGFTHGYGGRFTYDRWDGHTVEIDPKTKTIKRKLASVNLLAQDVLVEVIRRVSAKGGVVIANSYPGTRTVHAGNILYCLETAGGGKVCARLHLAPSVIALGNPGKCDSARDVYDDVRDKLEWGALYFYYGEKGVPSDTIVTQMYPITVEQIHRGTIKGTERIITLNSGVYGWHGGESLHLAYRYDGRGVPAPHGFVTTVDGDGVRTEIVLGKQEAAVLKKIPVSVKSPTAVNLVARQYDAEAIRLVLNGKGDVAIMIRDGEFDVRPGETYTLRIDERRSAVAPKDGAISFSVPVRRQTRVRIERAASR